MPSDSTPHPPNVSPERQAWLSVLAKAPAHDLDTAFRQLAPPPSYRVLRPAEVGLVMVEARAGGTGQRFCLGEMTVSRCAVQSPSGHTGLGYVQGRALRAAEQAAALDALLQDEQQGPTLQRTVIQPLQQQQQARQQVRETEAADTRVEFFTLVRGEDE